MDYNWIIVKRHR